MVAAHRRLNHAHPVVDLAAGKNLEDDVAGVSRRVRGAGGKRRGVNV